MNNVMTALNSNTNVVTMTSLELVDFINSQRKQGDAHVAHSDFMKKVPKVLGEVGLGKFSDTYIHPQNGQEYKCYRFPKREACLMAMSYSYDLQAKVFDRMTELEEAVSKPKLPQTYLQALEALVESEKQKEVMIAKIEADKHKVEYAEAVEMSESSILISTFAKHLGIKGLGPNKMMAWLRDSSFLMSSEGKHNLPFQQYITNGWFEVKQYVLDDGTLKFTPMITGKGQIGVAKALGVKQFSPLVKV